MTAPPLRWGILGPGWIADRFVSALKANTRQEVVAVGSRSLESARRFAYQHGIAKAHGSYADLVSDVAVDVVYVATPHNFHVEHGLLAIEAGKHVLVEKPMALDSAGLESLLAAAAVRQVMVQEAFWTYFLPKFDVIRQLIDDGVLGATASIVADNGEWLAPTHRIHDPALAGGSLHDLGVYVLSFSTWIAGRPDTVLVTGRGTSTGVIGDVAIAARTSDGVVSSLSTTMLANTPTQATIAGTEASLTIDPGFYLPGGFTVSNNRTGRTLRYDEPTVRHSALYFEAAEVARSIHAGQLATSTWGPDRSRDATATLDKVKAQLVLPL